MNKNIFGTAGIRAQAGQYPLDQTTLLKLGQVLTKFFINKYGPNCHILIASDTRTSSYFIKSLIKAGLLSGQVLVYDAQILPTPTVMYLVHELKKYDAGIIITASHNPYTDNGIKLVDRLTGHLTNDAELEISAHILNPNYDANLIDFNLAGKEYHVKSIIDTYSQKILDKFSQTNFKNLKVIIDCANGATSNIAPAVFSKLGINVTAINTNPNGTNINQNCGATHPDVLRQAVLKYQAQIGFAFDGDGDRILAITASGEIKTGDDLVGFLTTNIKYQSYTNIIGTVVSNLGLELWLNKNNKNLIRTDVGEKNLLPAMISHNCEIGGEASGHIILKDFAKHSDGIFVALRVLETAANNNNWDLNTFTRTPQVSINIPVKIKHDLANNPIAQTINSYQKIIAPGRLIVRYSGTENYLRIILEGENSELLKQNIKNIEHDLSILLN